MRVTTTRCGLCMGTGHCCPRDQGLGPLVCGPRRKTRTCSLVSTPGQAGRWGQLSPVASRRSPPTPMSLVGVGCLGLQEAGGASPSGKSTFWPEARPPATWPHGLPSQPPLCPGWPRCFCPWLSLERESQAPLSVMSAESPT